VTSISTMRQRPTLAPRLCLDPVECLLDMFANARADGIAAVPGRSPVNRRAGPLAFCATCHIHRAQLADEVFCVVGLCRRQGSRSAGRHAARSCAARGEAHIQSTSSNAIAPSTACGSLEKDSILWPRRACRSRTRARAVTDRTCGISQKDGFACVLMAPSAGTRASAWSRRGHP
jgi:hypothetical protein